MITQNRYDIQGDITYQGLSTDAKPTEDIIPNALFFEFDTGDVYYWDGSAWAKIGG